MKETLDVLKSIFSNANFFTNWFVLTTLIIVAVFSIIVFITWKFKNGSWSMLIALVLGFVLIGLLLIIKNHTTINNNINEFTMNLLHLPGLLFINLVLIAVPFFLVLVVSGLVFNSDFNEVKKSTYGVSFASLFGLTILGILVALLISPLILLIPDSIWPIDEDALIKHTTETSFAYGWVIVLGTIWFTFILSVIIKLIMKEKIEPLAKLTDKGTSILTKYFKYLVVSVPYIMMLRIGSIGLSESPESGIAFLFFYLGIFWLGAVIITAILKISTLSLSDKNLTLKQKSLIIGKQWLNVFGIQSMSASLESTIETTKDLGVCKEIANITPKKGMFMGMVMCNGFTPMIIVLFAMIYEDMFTIWNVLLAITIILTLSFSTSGSGSADYVITMTTLSTIGVPSHLYFDNLLWVNEINEMTISKPTNNLGHIVATLITDKHHMSQKDCCLCSCEHDHSNDNNKEEIKTS